MLQSNVPIEAKNIRAYTDTAEASLRVLRNVGATVDAMSTDCRMMRSLDEAGTGLAQIMRKIEKSATPNAAPIDPESRISDTLAEVADGLRRRVTQFARNRRSIDQDGNLSPAQRELLHTAYEEYLTLLASLAETLADLAGCVIGYELARESRDVPAFDSAEELRVHLIKQ